MKLTYDFGFTNGYKDGINGIKREHEVDESHPYAQGYAIGWSNGNATRQVAISKTNPWSISFDY